MGQVTPNFGPCTLHVNVEEELLTVAYCRFSK